MTRSKRQDRPSLGSAVKEIRKEAGISAAELANKAGLSRSYISYVESDRFQEIGLDKFARIAVALDVSADQLLSAAGYLPRERETLDIRVALRHQLGLKGGALDQAMEFLRFLTDSKKQLTVRTR